MEPTSEKPRGVLKAETVVRTVVSEPLRTGSEVFVRIGGAVWLVGLVQVLLLWFPLDFRNPGWRFGTVAQTMDALPTWALGAALLSYGLVRGPETDGSRIQWLSLAFFALAAAFPLLGLMYVSALPAVFAEAPDTSSGLLRSAVARTVVGLVVACVACVSVAIVLKRGLRERDEGVDGTRRAVDRFRPGNVQA